MASDRDDDDQFGYSVSISSDFIVVGACFEGTGGKAYIYEKDMGGGDNWGERKILVSSDRAGGDLFGYAVGISGEYVIISAVLENEDASGAVTLDAAGSCYLFGKMKEH